MLERKFEDARILIVDDQDANVQLLRRILLPAGYHNLESTSDPFRVAELVAEYEPDLILLDLLMPGKDGFEVMAELQDGTPGENYIPIVILTSDQSQQAKRQALSGGARDFLTKPLSPSEVRLRVRNHLEVRFFHQALRDHNRLLEERVRERTSELERARLEILHRLAEAAEYRDDNTGEHTRRVGRMSGAIALALELDEDEVELIQTVAPLHDVGKIGIPDRILLDPAPLSPADFEVMKTHTTIGGNLLGGSEFALLEKAAEIALTHHEHWDGGGYPRGLAGPAIPISGRIVSVADTYDALTHERPYKRAWSVEEALHEVRRQSGHQFDPEVVAAFEKVVRVQRPEAVRVKAVGSR